ncbi:hypothetical protein D9757_000008 [Collybiopsis confluens]|uniref:DUF1479-domain-containing protein n=1 Tax=Collybiopsis confluens TaxID=2823264 RepID=A0A8H5MGH4_9AGAR|nr:hypothetical protein D9757_000008 [Collybiopsis confluens]
MFYPDFEVHATRAWAEITEELGKLAEMVSTKGPDVTPVLYIPQVNFSGLSSLSPEKVEEIRQIGTVVIRDVIDDGEAQAWKNSLNEFVTVNPNVEGFPEDDKQFFQLYWTKPQVQARSHPNLLEASSWLNKLYRTSSENPLEGVDLSTPLTYADRFRIRHPGIQWDAHPLMSTVRGGAIERWEDPNFRTCFEHILTGEWRKHDPYALDSRLNARSSMYQRPNQASVFRTFQGWVSMSETAPTQGTLKVFPNVLLSNASNGLLIDISSSDFPGIIPRDGGFTGPRPTPALHPHMMLDKTMISVPKVMPGDTVFWHCDVVHAVEFEHTGNGDSAGKLLTMMYIPAMPTTPVNKAYVERQKETFLQSVSPPDFPKSSQDFIGGARPADLLSPPGFHAMGLPIASVDANSLQRGHYRLLEQALGRRMVETSGLGEASWKGKRTIELLTWEATRPEVAAIYGAVAIGTRTDPLPDAIERGVFDNPSSPFLLPLLPFGYWSAMLFPFLLLCLLGMVPHAFSQTIEVINGKLKANIGKLNVTIGPFKLGTNVDSNCFPALGFNMPSSVPSTPAGWWCDKSTEYAFVGFGYEVTACQSRSQLTTDFKNIRKKFQGRYVRLYGACDNDGFYDDVIEAAWTAGIGVHALIWFGFNGDNKWMTRRDNLFNTLQSNPKAPFVTRVVQFGSEPLFDDVLSPQALANQVWSAKADLANLMIPVTVSDMAYGYQERDGAPQVMNAIDFVDAHMLPFFSYEASTANNSWPLVLEDLDWFVNNANGKKIYLSENGWPSTTYPGVEPNSPNAVADVQNEQDYYNLLDSQCSYFKNVRGGGVGWFAHLYSDNMEPGVHCTTDTLFLNTTPPFPEIHETKYDLGPMFKFFSRKSANDNPATKSLEDSLAETAAIRNQQQLRTPSPSVTSAIGKTNFNLSPSGRGAAQEPPITPSPPPDNLLDKELGLISDPAALHALISSIPPKILHEYTLSHLIPPTRNSKPIIHPPPSLTLTHLTSFFSSLTPPPQLHCIRCHKSYYDVENAERSCLVPHDDESAEVERVGGKGPAEYETLWNCCGRTVEGDGDMGPPDGWCYEGKHTTDPKRARFRADSTLHDDKLVSCHRLKCYEAPPSDDGSSEGSVTSSHPRKRKRSTRKREDKATVAASAEQNQEVAMDEDNDDARSVTSTRSQSRIKKKLKAIPAEPSSPLASMSTAAETAPASKPRKKRAKTAHDDKPFKPEASPGEEDDGDGMDVDDSASVSVTKKRASRGTKTAKGPSSAEGKVKVKTAMKPRSKINHSSVSTVELAASPGTSPSRGASALSGERQRKHSVSFADVTADSESASTGTKGGKKTTGGRSRTKKLEEVVASSVDGGL